MLSLIIGQLPNGVVENEHGVLLGVPDVFKFENKRLRFTVRAIFHLGFWVGSVNVMGRNWGYSGPTMLVYSEKFPSLPLFIESELPYMYQHLVENNEEATKQSFIKYYEKWKSDHSY